MRSHLQLSAPALAGLLFLPATLAQSADSRSNGIERPEFAAPVRLQAGKEFLGQGRLYPSPVYHDMNGDGRLDIVVGDLWGKLTVALREPGSSPAIAGETKLNGTDGEVLDFANW